MAMVSVVNWLPTGGLMDAAALFKLLNMPLALLLVPALCLDSLLTLHARHERPAMGKSKDDQ